MATKTDLSKIPSISGLNGYSLRCPEVKLKRIDDGLWRLGSLLETHYGELKENETITIQAKRFTAIITRTPEQKVSLIKKIATERITEK